MDEQKGFFGLLDKYLMGPMSVIAQYKVVRAITAAGMAVVPFTIVGSMFLVFSILPQAFSFWPIVADVFSASFDKFKDCKLRNNGNFINIFCSFSGV